MWREIAQPFAESTPVLSRLAAASGHSQDRFSTVNGALANRFSSEGDATMELFEDLEVFYNQSRRHSTV